LGKIEEKLETIKDRKNKKKADTRVLDIRLFAIRLDVVKATSFDIKCIILITDFLGVARRAVNAFVHLERILGKIEEKLETIKDRKNKKKADTRYNLEKRQRKERTKRTKIERE